MLFIENAMAQTGGSGGAGILQFLPMVLILVVFYFLLIRPQQKKAKAHREMVGSLSENDEVITAGGFLGTITKVDEQFVYVKIAESTTVKVQRASIGQVLPKGSVEG